MIKFLFSFISFISFGLSQENIALIYLDLQGEKRFTLISNMVDSIINIEKKRDAKYILYVSDKNTPIVFNHEYEFDRKDFLNQLKEISSFPKPDLKKMSDVEKIGHYFHENEIYRRKNIDNHKYNFYFFTSSKRIVSSFRASTVSEKIIKQILVSNNLTTRAKSWDSFIKLKKDVVVNVFMRFDKESDYTEERSNKLKDNFPNKDSKNYNYIIY